MIESSHAAGLDVHFMLGLPAVKRGPAYTAIRLAEALHGDNVRCSVFSPINRWPPPGVAVPLTTGTMVSDRLVSRLPYRLTQPIVYPQVERRLLKAISKAHGEPVVYSWGETSLRLARRLKHQGVAVVREKINCAKAVSRRILDDAYADFGAPSGHKITSALIEKEREEAHLADAIFCPSPMVKASLIEIGIPESRLIPSSYGWEPNRFTGTTRALPPINGPTFLFVGYVCVRKGAHILLEAWRRAGIAGRLVLVGDIEPVIAQRYADVLTRSDVTYLKFTPDVGAVYRSADWFIFPSLEEGSPLVTYEAAGNGLPAMVSEMGAGGFVRHGVEGEILTVRDPVSWAEAIVRLGSNPEAQAVYSANAKARSLEFTWGKIGEQRREALYERFGRDADR